MFSLWSRSQSNDDCDYRTVGLLSELPGNACEQLPFKFWGFQLNKILSGKYWLSITPPPPNFQQKLKEFLVHH